MKYFIPLFIYLLLSASLYAQNIVPLELALKNANTDTAKSSIAIQLTSIYQAQNIEDKALYYAKNSLTFAVASNDQLYIARAYYVIGRTFRFFKDFDEAAIHLRKSLFFFQNNSNSAEILKVKLEIARCWAALANYKPALNLIKEILPQFAVLKDSLQTGYCYVEMANIYARNEKINEAEADFMNALKYFSSQKYKLENTNINRELAEIYKIKGRYSQSLDTYLGCLKAAEEIHDKNQKGTIFYDIALLYVELEMNFKALKYFQEAEKMKTAVSDNYYLSLIFNQMAEIYMDKNEFTKALVFYKMSIIKANAANATETTTNAHFKIAKAYLAINEGVYVALYLKKALGLAIGNKDKKSETNIYSLYAEYYKNAKNKNYAIIYYKKAHQFAILNKYVENAKTTAEKLSELYFETNRMEDAYKYLHFANTLSDSVSNLKFKKKLIRLQTQYEFERRARSKKFEDDKKEEELLTNFKLVKQQKEYALFAIIFLFLISILLYKAYIDKKKSNKTLSERNFEIEIQTDEITIKNRRITDSILYAQRIQKAALTPIDQLDAIFNNNYFLVYKPKDIVSGDFYLAKRKGNLKFMVIADCTGHGVPGAFMSMMGISLLNEILSRPEVIEPAEALNLLRDKVIEALHQKTGIGGFKDGMSISICSINTETLEMNFSGSYHPLYVVRDGAMFEFRGERIPISIYTKTKETFSNNQFQLQTNDMVYMYTDGYVDQIGGPNNKKFYPKQLKEILISTANASVEEQRTLLNETIENWRGNEEQIDDILLMGVRV